MRSEIKKQKLSVMSNFVAVSSGKKNVGGTIIQYVREHMGLIVKGKPKV